MTREEKPLERLTTFLETLTRELGRLSQGERTRAMEEDAQASPAGRRQAPDQDYPQVRAGVRAPNQRNSHEQRIDFRALVICCGNPIGGS